MAKYKIYFLGLICHVGNYNRKQFAALVYDPGHVAVVATKEHCLLVDPDEIIRFTDDGGNDISGDAFISDDLFNESVLHLQALLGGDLEATVTPHTGGLAGYAQYPAGGQLQVAKVFPYEALHVGKYHDRRGCVARLTLLTIDVPKLKVWVNQVPVEIGGDWTVLIANVPIWGAEYDALMSHCPQLTVSGCNMRTVANHTVHAHNATDHFNLFGSIVKGDISCTVLQTGNCHLTLQPVDPDWVDRVMPPIVATAGTNIGCGNTNWP